MEPLAEIFKLPFYRSRTRIPVFIAFSRNVPVRKCTKYLHPHELKYMRQITHKGRKAEFILGRLAAKSAAAAFLGEKNLKQVEIAKAVLEYPFVKHMSREHPGLSISHINGWAVSLAFPEGHNMGIDIARHDLPKTQVYRRILTPNELRLCKKLPGLKMHSAACCLLWTLKEAVSKAIHCGFTTSYSVLEIKNLKILDQGVYEAYFNNLKQYKGLGVVGVSHCLSMVMPFKTVLKGSLKKLLKSFLSY